MAIKYFHIFLSLGAPIYWTKIINLILKLVGVLLNQCDKVLSVILIELEIAHNSAHQTYERLQFLINFVALR